MGCFYDLLMREVRQAARFCHRFSDSEAALMGSPWVRLFCDLKSALFHLGEVGEEAKADRLAFFGVELAGDDVVADDG